MGDERTAEASIIHGQMRQGGLEDDPRIDLTDAERAQVASLARLADRLQASMQLVHPSPAFVRSLREELVEEAEHRMTRRKRRQRVAMIGAAVFGSVVSVASVVGAIVVLVKWLRTRTQARHAPAG